MAGQIRWMSALVCLVASSLIGAARTADPLADLDGFVATALTDYRVPGAAVGVVQNGKVVMVKGYGVRDATRPGKVDENTIFQLASVTKALTGVAVGTVVDKEKLDLDTPIVNYLPEFMASDPYMTRYLTERDLLAHRTGWPAYQGDAVDSFGYSRAEIVRRLRYFKPRYSLREVAQYSNPGIFLAGEVAARVAGQSWNDLVEMRVYEPLGMTRSGTVTAHLEDDNLSANHVLQGDKAVLTTRTVEDTTGAASSGTSTARDMARFLAMLLNDGAFEGRRVLQSETVAQMFKRSMVADIEFTEMPPISEATGFYYGLGVHSYDYAGNRIIEKAGGLSGVRTILTLIPERNAGIVVLANLNVAPFPEAVRAFFLDQTLGIPSEAHQKEIFERNEALKSTFKPPERPAHPPKFAGAPGSLVGVYDNDYYGRCAIELGEGDLELVCGPAKYTGAVTHWSGGEFVVQFPGATQLPTSMTFNIGADGKADSFTHEVWGLFTRVRK
jgi:CubicO group peptidase (beta-lactamase class C family)